MIIGAGHGVGTIGIMLIAVPFFMEDFSLCLSNIFINTRLARNITFIVRNAICKGKKANATTKCISNIFFPYVIINCWINSDE